MLRLHTNLSAAMLLGACLMTPAFSQAPPQGAQGGRGGRGGQNAAGPRKKQLLVIGDNHTGFQHESTSHAMAVIERIGYESGLFDVTIKTDTQLITKGEVNMATGFKRFTGHNLSYFDAIFYYGAGEDSLSAQQKADLISFVKEDGKGLVVAHNGNNAFYTWPEFGEMVGGYFDNHPWGTFDAPVVVEDPSFPGMDGFPVAFTFHDEMFVPQAPYSRDKVRVLLRMDASKLDMTKPDIHRTDRDFPLAWARTYGKGRVFYSTLGHPNETWDNKAVQKMWLEAIKWSMGMTNPDVTPRPLPAAATGGSDK